MLPSCFQSSPNIHLLLCRHLVLQHHMYLFQSLQPLPRTKDLMILTDAPKDHQNLHCNCLYLKKNKGILMNNFHKITGLNKKSRIPTILESAQGSSRTLKNKDALCHLKKILLYIINWQKIAFLKALYAHQTWGNSLII